MAKILDRQRVIALRQKGKTYSEIRLQLGIAKSTLSNWLRNYPLTDDQLSNLQTNKDRLKFLAREKTSITKRLKHQMRLHNCYNDQKLKLLPLNKKELFLAGLFLYWGEGAKTHKGQISISNTDPSVLKFSLLWMIKALEIPKEKITVLLHLYSDMDIDITCEYWSQALNISRSQFAKPYIKMSSRTEIDYKGFGQGTCMLRVSNTLLREKILMSMQVMADYSNKYILEI